MTLPQKIIFCLPAQHFSTDFFNSWNATTTELDKLGISYAYSTIYDPVIYYARNRILGGTNLGGKNQKPWSGQFQYDKMVWIDSDIVWSPTDLVRLISHDKEIVAGAYLMKDNMNYAIVENLDWKFLETAGSFKFLNRTDIANKTEPFVVSYSGFGFISVKNGVMESMNYPWFYPRWVSTDNFHDFCSEDVSWCWTANDLGYQIWVDPSIKVGHEKRVILK